MDDLPARHSIRLPHFDYSRTGQYFVTICSFQKNCTFGQIVEGQIRLSPLGQIVRDCWLKIPSHFSYATLDPFVVMPNHLHGILTLQNPNGHGNAVPLPHRAEDFQEPVSGSIPTIIRSYKAAVTYTARKSLRRRPLQIWQSNYFERVLRSGEEFFAASHYIIANPVAWDRDKYNSRRGTALPCPLRTPDE